MLEILQISFWISLIICIFMVGVICFSQLPDKIYGLLLDWYEWAYNNGSEFDFFVSSLFYHYFKKIIVFIIIVLFSTGWIFVEILLFSKTISLIK